MRNLVTYGNYPQIRVIFANFQLKKQCRLYNFYAIALFQSYNSLLKSEIGAIQSMEELKYQEVAIIQKNVGLR